MSVYCLLTDIVLFLILLAASAADLRTGRVPNSLILGGGMLLLLLKAEALLQSAAAGVPLSEISAGVLHPADPAAAAAAVVITVILLFLRRIGALGGGDVKLLILILLAEPADRGLRMLAAAFAAGGLWSLAVMLKRGILRERMERLRLYLREPSAAVHAYYKRGRDDPRAVIPFAPVICIGAMLARLTG